MTKQVQQFEPEWTDWVMSQFENSELVSKDDKRHPKVGGLRRVCQKILGPIIRGDTRVIQPPNPSNEFTAVVEYSVTVKTQDGEVTFSSSADASRDNTDPVFRMYPTAIAETRAEARALRKALKIDIAAADELSNVAKLDAEMAQPAQLVAIRNLMSKQNISRENLEKNFGVSYQNGQPVLTKEEASKLVKDLQKGRS